MKADKGDKARRCGLCGSAAHWYTSGAYEHSDQIPITKACFKYIGAPGGVMEECGLKHAFSGPLKTPCRVPGDPLV